MTVSRKAVEEQVRRLAAEHPTRVYDRGEGRCESGCSYNPDERNPDGCIIGAALRAVECDTSQLRGTVSQIRDDVFDEPESDDDRSLDEWLDCVQFAQDIGGTWGDAVRLTDEVFAEPDNKRDRLMTLNERLEPLLKANQAAS